MNALVMINFTQFTMFSSLVRTFAAVLAICLLPVVCLAQVSDHAKLSLSATIDSARRSLDSRRLPDLASVEAEVIRSAEGVEDYFRPITPAENLQKWMVYVATEPLVEAIRSKASEEIVLEHAQRTHERLIGNIAGLELSALRKLRDSVDRLIAIVRFKDGAKSIKTIDQQLASLGERLAGIEGVPSAEEAASLAALVKLIDASNQSPAVLSSLRGVFSRPNVVVSVGSSLVQQAASQVVSRDRAINDCILGTRVIGSGRLQGSVVANTFPSHGQAQVQLTLCARFTSQSVGYNGPVRVGTIGSGDVQAQRTLFITETGVSLSPTTTSATLSSQITSIDAPLRLIRKIASKKAAEQKPQAERIARDRLQEQVGTEFGSQIDQVVSQRPANNRDATLSKVRTTLHRLNVPEPSRTIGSTRQSIYLEATQAAPDQLSAANSAPPLAAGSFDLAFQLQRHIGGSTSEFGILPDRRIMQVLGSYYF